MNVTNKTTSSLDIEAFTFELLEDVCSEYLQSNGSHLNIVDFIEYSKSKKYHMKFL